MKKILSAIIILTMIISTLSMVVFATETAENTGDLMGVTLTAKTDLASGWSGSGISTEIGGFTPADLDENNYLAANFKVRNNGTKALSLVLSFFELKNSSWIYEPTTVFVAAGQSQDFAVKFKTPFTKDGDNYTFIYTRDGNDYVIDLKNVTIRFQSSTAIDAGTSFDITCTDENGYEKLALFKGKGGDKYTVEDYRAVGSKTVDEPTLGGASIITTNRNHRCSSPSQSLLEQVQAEGLGKYYVSGYVRLLQTPDAPITVELGAQVTADGTNSFPIGKKTTINDTQWHKVEGTWTINKENITAIITFAQVLYEGQSGDAGAYKGDMEWDAFTVCRIYDDGSYSENLLVNPDMNIDSTGATSGWGKNQGFTMANSLVIPSNDENALHAVDRSSNTSGPSQNILGRLEKGMYLYSGYVRLIEAPEEAKSVSLGIEYKYNGENGITATWPSVKTTIDDTEWHKISGTVEIKYDVVNHAVTFVNTSEKSGEGADIEFDGVFLAKQDENGLYGENIILNPTMEYDEETGETSEWGLYRVAAVTNTGYNKTEEPEIPTDPVENPDGSITYPDGTVPVTDKNIIYSGRWYDYGESSKQVAFEGYTEIKFTGTSIKVIPGTGSAYAEIDGALGHTLYPMATCTITGLSAGEHTLKLFSQSQNSRFSIGGFILDKNAKTMPINEPKKIEFIGDSISEGYVNAADKLPDLAGNSYLNSFTLKTGRKLNAEYGWSFNTVAYGGIGMVLRGHPDPLTMGERYFAAREYKSSTDGETRESALAAAGTYDRKYVPDYIVINMGTNDSSQDNKVFLNAYVDFIASLKEVNPNVTIFCMAPFNGSKALQVRMAAETYGEEEKVFFIDSSKWDIPGGADNLHPAPASLDKAAEKLFAVIKDYVDNGVVPENAPFVNGMQFNVTSDLYHAYPYFRAGATNAAGLSVAEADENGYIERTYTIYNVGNCDLPIRTYWQTGWDDVEDTTASATLTVEKGKKATITLQIQIDENGMVTRKKDSVKVDLSTLTLRTQIDIGTSSSTVIPAGASYIVTPDDPMDFAVLNISSKGIQKGENGTGATTYNTIEKLPSEKIMGATLDIGSSLTVNYYAQLWDNLDATLKVTRNSSTVELAGTYDSATGYYIYSYKGINPQCMTDNISAELVAGGEVIDSKAEYSVKAYAENQAAKTAEKLNLTEEKYNKLIALLSDMLVYGKNSQDYMKYNLDNYATDGITWLKASEFVTPANIVKNIVKNDENNKITGAGVRVENVNKIYFTVNITDANAEVYVDGEKAEIVDNKVYTKDIKATGFSDVHTAEVKVNGEVVSKVEYNVNAYINSKNNSETIGALVKALSNYGASAVAYGK